MKNRLKPLVQFLALSVLAGLILSAPLMIPAFGVGRAVHEGEQLWDSLPKDIEVGALPQRSRILDKDGNLIAEFYSENRVPVTYEQLPDTMKDAIVSVEDERFYEHGAVDSTGTLRALASTSLGNTQGGSTLTQQYVKNLRLYQATTDEERAAATEQTPRRKLEEMSLAMEVEKKYSKEDILTGYLNIANFGDGAYGVGAAAQHYFGIPVEELSIDQAALLAGIVNSPAANNPVKNPEQSTSRRNLVLSRMLTNGKITQEEYDAAKATPLTLNITSIPNGCSTSAYPFFCQMVRNTLSSNSAFGATPEAREQFLYQGGLTIHTTLDPKVQQAADKAATDALGPDNQFASSVAVVEPGTGYVRGIGTNKKFGSGENETEVNLATSRFQNGSTFKPVTLAAALENGWDLTTTINAQSRYCAPAPNTGCFTNLSSYQSGPMNAVDGTVMSSNTFFTELSVRIGTDKVQDTARRLGFQLPDDLSGNETATTLGVYDVSTIQVANAYATFAAHGEYCSPTWITSIDGPSGPVEVPQPNCYQALAPDVADKVAMTLTNTIDGPNPHRTAKDLNIGRPAMGKTGTTSSQSSVWFAGGTPQYQSAVWVGDPRGGFEHPIDSINLYGKTERAVWGSTAAGPIWQQTMLQVHEGVEVQPFSVSSTSGQTKQQNVVPDVRGLAPEAAISTLERSGFEVSISPDMEANAVYPPDTIVGQSEEPGTTVKQGTSVTLVLSEGSTPVQVKADR